MTETGLKKLFYLRLLSADELAEQICCLPYTLVETIIETALNDEDFMMDMLTEIINILKENMHQCNVKRALRKLLKVSQVLGCTGYFDFGDWDTFRDTENRSGALTAYEILFVNYPAFREHFSILKTAEIIKETENGLKWNRTDISLAEYFACIKCKENKQNWVVIDKDI
jgi:hypothetical protein